MSTHPVQLYISGFNQKVNEKALREYFQKYGVIVDVFVPKENNARRKHRGFGYVTFSKFYDKHPCDDNDPHVINGCVLHVDRNENTFTTQEKSSVLMVNGTIQNLPTSALQEYFSKFGNVIDIIRKTNKTTHTYLRFAFVQYDSFEAVEKAINQKHQVINGEVVHVRKAKHFESNHVEIEPNHDEITPNCSSSPQKFNFLSDENRMFLKYRILPLDETMTVEVLREYFSRFGEVVDSYIPKEYGTAEKKLFGYVILGFTSQNKKLRYGTHIINGKDVNIELDLPSRDTTKSKCIIVSASPIIIAKISEKQLRGFFKQFGKVVDVRKPLDTKLKTTTHYAFVEFQLESVVEEIVSKLNYYF